MHDIVENLSKEGNCNGYVLLACSKDSNLQFQRIVQLIKADDTDTTWNIEINNHWPSVS